MHDSEAQNSLAFAFQYGFPLFAYGRWLRSVPNATTNTFYHQQQLATADWKTVVRPNTDTLYSTAWFDLSADDLSISLPEFDGRFWLFSFYDMYGDNFANIGSLGGHRAGKYLLRFATENFGLRTEEGNGEYLASLRCPTPYGGILARIITYDQKDIAKVARFQDSTSMERVVRESGTVAPCFDLSIFHQVAGSESSPADLEEQVLRLTAALSPHNQPSVISDRAWVNSILTKAGIQDGIFTQPPETSMDDLLSVSAKSVTALMKSAGFVTDLGNGWEMLSSLLNGQHGSFYQARYDTTIRGYLRLTSDVSIYPVYSPRRGESNIKIGPNQACLFTFSGKPKLQKTGWWSLTLYNDEHFFIDNKLNRYALGDRSNLTYPDGTPLGERDDGKFQILVQPSDIEPPANWTSNWLPAPAGGGEVGVTFRLFGGASQMVDGSYVYPEVKIVDAVREDGKPKL